MHLNKIIRKFPYLKRIFIEQDALQIERDTLRAERAIVNQKRKKILFIAMPQSIHTARWISQINKLEWEIHLFPSMPVNGLVHPALTHTTIHFPFNRDLESEKHIEQFYAFKLKKLIKELQPDIIHSLEMQHAGYLTALVKKNYNGNFPVWMYSCWGSDIYYFQQFEDHKERITEVLVNCNFLFTDSKRDIYLAKEYGFTGEVLGTFPVAGGFKIDEMRSVCTLKDPSERKIIVLKGYSAWVTRPCYVLLEALEQCKDVLQGYKIVVYLPWMKEIVKETDRLSRQLMVNFEIFPYTTVHSEVVKLFASARLALASSISDGVPNSMLEAMTMGAFPIQSDTVSTAEWIQHEVNGMLIAPEDVKGFASAIKKALTDDEMVDRAAEFNLQLLRERIDYSVVQPQVIEAYRKVLTINSDNT
jgi:glycosyltransferase involved in cell wall biosynthesis